MNVPVLLPVFLSFVRPFVQISLLHTESSAKFAETLGQLQREETLTTGRSRPDAVPHFTSK